MTPFGKWLAEVGLGTYEDVFAANKIDFDVIHLVSDADLRELGLPLGDRKRLLQAIATRDGLRAAESVTEPAMPVDAVSASFSGPAGQHGAERRPLSVMFCDLIGPWKCHGRNDNLALMPRRCTCWWTASD